ncbi:MAG: DUF2079 domain-containing protein [Candidatus Omnitrophica bacterium]|nr:DUF2079 domain-containing protein [Candidatus Omnitrophota bacterium]
MNRFDEPSRTGFLSRAFSFLGWACFAFGVALSGMAVGIFIAEWVRTPDNGSVTFIIGERWIHVFAALIPFGESFKEYWFHSFWMNFTTHFPGIVVGSLLSLFLWVALSMNAAWQNCLLFPVAMRRIGYRILALLVYLILAWLEYHNEFLIRQWIAFLPLGVVFFLVGSAMSRTQAEALPVERKNPLQSEVDPRVPLLILSVLCLMRFWDWYNVCWMRHNHFYSQAYDLGLMTHVMNRFVTGHGLTSSLLISGGSFLGHHFSPILFLIAPFSFFCPHPETLLLFQSGLVAFAAIPLYFFARTYLKSNWVGFAAACIYLYLPGLSNGVYGDFHAICFTPFLLFWLAAEMVRGGSRRLWIVLALLLCVQENMCIYALFLGLFFATHKAFRRTGLMVSGISVIAGLLIFLVFQPMLRTDTDLGYGFAHRYKDFLPDAGPTDAGMWDIFKGVITQPGTVLSLLFDDTRRGVFKLFWRGPLYLPLVNPAGWLILFPVLENSLSSEAFIHEWGGHYGIGPASLTALAMVAGLGLLGRIRPLRDRFVPVGFTLLASSVIWALKKAHLPYSIYLMSIYFATPLPSDTPDTSRVLLEEIPPGSSVSALSYYVPHLTHQDKLYELPPGEPLAIGEIVDSSAPNFELLEPDVGWPDYLVYNPETPDGNKWHNLWFYNRDRALEWLDWLQAQGIYRQFYPKPVGEETESPIIILKRVENRE